MIEITMPTFRIQQINKLLKQYANIKKYNYHSHYAINNGNYHIPLPSYFSRQLDVETIIPRIK